jgi:hypothetical protein
VDEVFIVMQNKYTLEVEDDVWYRWPELKYRINPWTHQKINVLSGSRHPSSAALTNIKEW